MAGTVTVGCKIPNGMILEVNKKQVLINGSNSSLIIGGHGITEGVDKDFFEAWIAENKELSTVKGGFIFAHGKTEDAKAEAKDRKKNKTGLEPLDQEKKPTGIQETDKE